MNRKALLLTLCAVVATVANAQTYFEPRFGEITLKSATQIRETPDPASRAIADVPAGTKLRWVEGQTANGFNRVLGPKGEQGWVSEDAVEDSVRPEAASIDFAPKPPCFTPLNKCPAIGCAAADPENALFNKQKQTIPKSTKNPTVIDFDDLADLQAQADPLVQSGRSLTAADRAKLKGLKVKKGMVNEGSVVQLTGFLASEKLPPHANTGESVNCRLPGPDNNDFHITVTPSAKQTEFQGIVVEMIPQKRNKGWTLMKLRRVKDSQQAVLVTGALFYDNEHVVNKDPDREMSSQPRRMSLWEIHPVTAFLVCTAASGSCDPAKPAGWTPLEKLP